MQIGDFNTYMSLLKEYYENYSDDYSVYIPNELGNEMGKTGY